MAGEEPEVGGYVELGLDGPLAELAAVFRDFGDPVEHQHGGKRQLRIAGPKQLSTGASENILLAELRLSGVHHAARFSPLQ